jgi:hypothetical protein
MGRDRLNCAIVLICVAALAPMWISPALADIAPLPGHHGRIIVDTNTNPNTDDVHVTGASPSNTTSPPASVNTGNKPSTALSKSAWQQFVDFCGGIWGSIVQRNSSVEGAINRAAHSKNPVLTPTKSFPITPITPRQTGVSVH